MSTAIIILAFIALFVGTLVLIQFPAIATEIYVTMSSLFTYMGNASGLLWFFLPKTLTLTVIKLVIAIEVIVRAFKIFLFVYEKLKNG